MQVTRRGVVERKYRVNESEVELLSSITSKKFTKVSQVCSLSLYNIMNELYTVYVYAHATRGVDSMKEVVAAELLTYIYTQSVSFFERRYTHKLIYPYIYMFSC